MISKCLDWFARRQEKKLRVINDARVLAANNPRSAFYDAQRAIARARYAGNFIALRHWTRVAAEIARISDAPMEYEVVREIVEEEYLRFLSRKGLSEQA